MHCQCRHCCCCCCIIQCLRKSGQQQMLLYTCITTVDTVLMGNLMPALLLLLLLLPCASQRPGSGRHTSQQPLQELAGLLFPLLLWGWRCVMCQWDPVQAPLVQLAPHIRGAACRGLQQHSDKTWIIRGSRTGKTAAAQ
jgi:hypothetical protein